MNTFSVFDTETTGFKPSEGARVIEIAVCKVDSNGNQIGTFDTLLNIGSNASVGAEEIHKISKDMLTDAPTFSQIAPQLFEFLNGSILVAHNAPFDRSFLVSEMEQAGFNASNIFVADTLVAARKKFPGLPSYKLGELAKNFDISFEGDAHAALADAKVCASLFSLIHAQSKNLTWPKEAYFSQPSLLLSDFYALKSRSK